MQRIILQQNKSLPLQYIDVKALEEGVHDGLMVSFWVANTEVGVQLPPEIC